MSKKLNNILSQLSDMADELQDSKEEGATVLSPEEAGEIAGGGDFGCTINIGCKSRAAQEVE